MRKLKNSELNRKSIEEFRKAPKTPLILILEDIRSLNNIGSVFRTADAFMIEKIHLCGITATPPHRDIQKTALGATESVAWEYHEKIDILIASLKEKEVQLFAIEQAEAALSLEKLSPTKGVKYAFILGNEVKGVTQNTVNQCEGVIEIPQEGTKHSLNISVATGVVVWDFYSKVKQL
jgi:tRNA G18 (ribose-2'-O)-methylase SpoU|tara:strand:- start:741 stop:1274 length:534 start_codon:yes stop_codon:yes gene_type:complete